MLLPNILHFFGEAAIVQLLLKIQKAMAAGGRVATIDFVPNDDRVSPPLAAGFGLTMLANTEPGEVYTFAQLSAMFRKAGFGDSTMKVSRLFRIARADLRLGDLANAQCRASRRVGPGASFNQTARKKGANTQNDTVVDSLILDLLKWLAKSDRTYEEVMDAWRTSCPKLAVWEEANERLFVTTSMVADRLLVQPTSLGLLHLELERGSQRPDQNGTLPQTRDLSPGDLSSEGEQTG